MKTRLTTIITMAYCLTTITSAVAKEPAPPVEYKAKPVIVTKNLFCSPSAVMSLLPAKLPLKHQGSWSARLISKASSRIQRDAQGQRMILRGTVELLQPFEGGFRIKLPDGEVRQNGEGVGFRIWAYFDAAAARKLSKVSTGDTVVLVGLMRRADLRLYEGDRWPSLSIDIADTEIYVDPEKA
jgi:hypothetical protein